MVQGKIYPKFGGVKSVRMQRKGNSEKVIFTKQEKIIGISLGLVLS